MAALMKKVATKEDLQRKYDLCSSLAKSLPECNYRKNVNLPWLPQSTIIWEKLELQRESSVEFRVHSTVLLYYWSQEGHIALKSYWLINLQWSIWSLVLCVVGMVVRFARLALILWEIKPNRKKLKNNQSWNDSYSNSQNSPRMTNSE